jgi:hypothetical protein
MVTAFNSFLPFELLKFDVYAITKNPGYFTRSRLLDLADKVKETKNILPKEEYNKAMRYMSGEIKKLR